MRAENINLSKEEMELQEEEAWVEWMLEALCEGYTKKQLAKKEGMSLYKFNKKLKGHESK